MDSFDVCAQIRADARPLKGKKCPGGYSIPKGHTCGGDKSGPGAGRGREQASGPKIGAPKRKRTRAGAWIGAGIALGAIPLAATSIAAIEADRRRKEWARERGMWEEEQADRRRRQAQGMNDWFDEAFRRTQGPRAQSAGPPPGAREAAERSRNFAREEEDFARSFGLGSNPTKREVKAARIKAARQYHPDQFVGDEKARKAAEKKMQEINSVVDRLLNKARSDAAGFDMFVDIYPKWNSRYGRF